MKKIMSILIVLEAIVIIVIFNFNQKTITIPTTEIENDVESFLINLYDDNKSLVTNCDDPTYEDYFNILTGTEEYLVSPSYNYLPSVIPFDYLKDIYMQYCLNDFASVFDADVSFIETIDKVYWFRFEVFFLFEKTKGIHINGIIGTTTSGKIISFYSEYIHEARSLDKDIDYDHLNYYKYWQNDYKKQ